MESIRHFCTLGSNELHTPVKYSMSLDMVDLSMQPSWRTQANCSEEGWKPMVRQLDLSWSWIVSSVKVGSVKRSSFTRLMDAPMVRSNICIEALAKARLAAVRAAARTEPSFSNTVTNTSIWVLGYRCMQTVASRASLMELDISLACVSSLSSCCPLEPLPILLGWEKGACSSLQARMPDFMEKSERRGISRGPYTPQITLVLPC